MRTYPLQILTKLLQTSRSLCTGLSAVTGLAVIDRINLKHAALEMGSWTSVEEGIGFVGFLLRAPTPSQVKPDQYKE